MRIHVDSSVFVAGFRLELLVLAWLAGTGRHRLLPLEESAAQVQWEDSLDPDTRALWRAAIAASIERDATAPAEAEIIVSAAGVSSLAQSPPRAPVRDAMALLLRPYRLLLENSVNDRAFVLAACERAEREALEYAESQGWLVFEMGGGSAMIERARELCRSPLDARATSVLADRDALRPPRVDEREGATDGANATALRSLAARESALHAHVLRRRSIENYLPVQALRQINASAARTYETMKPAQRAHYNVKSGFAGDAGQARHGRTSEDLYSGLSRTDRDALNDGFGVDAARAGRWSIGGVDAEGRAELTTFARRVLARLR